MILAALLSFAIQVAPLDPAAEAKVRDVFDAALVDYTSARFRDLEVYDADAPRGRRITICGLSNSRNRAGGFSGWTEFAFQGHWDPSSGDWYSPPRLIWRDAAASRDFDGQVDQAVVNALIATCGSIERPASLRSADLTFRP